MSQKRKAAMLAVGPADVPRGNQQPYDHQLKFFIGFAGNPHIKGALMVFEVGTGKTLVAILCLVHWLRGDPDKRVVVLTPKSLVGNFRAAIQKFDAKLVGDARITITSFEQFITHKDISCENTLVILDEVHMLRKDSGNKDDDFFFDAKTDVAGAKVTRVQEIMRRCTHLNNSKVLLMTATIFINSVNNLNNLVAMVNKTAPVDKRVFEGSVEDPKFLRRVLGCRVAFYRVPPEVRKEHYPRVQVSMAKWVMTPEYLELYYGIERNFIQKQDEFSAKLTDINDLRPFYNGVRRSSLMLGEDKATKILNIIKLWRIDNKQRNKAMVVFTNFRTYGVTQIEKAFQHEGIRFAVIDGSTTSSMRDKAVVMYNNNRLDVLVLTNASATGLDLKRTRKIVVTELPWSWSQVQQIIGRGDRYDSHADLPPAERTLSVYIMTELKPIEERLFDPAVARLEQLKRHPEKEPVDYKTFMKEVMARDTPDEKQKLPSSDFFMYFYIMVANMRFERVVWKLEKIEDVYTCWRKNVSLDDLNP